MARHVKADMKTNITLKLDTGLVREARILAEEEGSSVSRLLAARLEEMVRERKGYACVQGGGPWRGCAKALTCAGHLLARETSFMSDKYFRGH